MSHIGATLIGVQQRLLNQLSTIDQSAVQSALRIATGKRVNSPADDPTDFVAIRSLETRLTKVESTQLQIEQAADVGAETQLALDNIRTELNTIRTTLLKDKDQTLSAADREANQAIIDASIAKINELAGEEAGGVRVLDGSADYRISGRNASQIRDLQVYSLNEASFSGTVSGAATQSSVRYTGASGTINSGDATFKLMGQRGNATISVTDGEALSAVATKINNQSYLTGITAAVDGDNLDLTTVDYGANATLNVDVTSGTLATTTQTTGTDALVFINGRQIAANQVDGNRVSYIHQGTHVTFEFQGGFAGNFDPITISDDDVLKFNLSTEANDVSKLAVAGIHSALIGGVSGTLSELLSGGTKAGLGANTAAAIRVVDEALGDITIADGRVDSFTDVTVASSKTLMDNVAAEIRGTLDSFNGIDQDAESLAITNAQALSNNAAAALSILQQQQFSMVSLLKLLAGI